MAYFDRDEDTICALTTGAGRSGIAVIRVSGPDAYSRVQQLCSFLPENPESHRIYYGHLSDRTQSSVIDEVLVSFFEEGRSFTGDQTCEISCHGNPIIASQILSELVNLGCRPADRGEFTYRAFMSGRIDLVQAESVLSLIESTSKKAARLSVDQLQGQLSRLFESLEADIIWILSRLEAGIDFSTEGIELVEPKEITSRLQELQRSINKLVESYQSGRLISDGIRIVLAGKPNAGKSSLLNALIRTERAIVSPIAGTTRDTVEVTYKIRGVSATLIDTAGLRETSDAIEILGVQRSRQALESADLVLFIVDAAAASADEALAELSVLEADKILILLNKVDVASSEQRSLLRERLAKFETLEISAMKGQGLEELERALVRIFSLDAADETAIVIHARHERALKAANSALERAGKAFESGMSHEFVCLDLREALEHIGSILGKGLSEDVINRIFKDFCIGK